MAKTTGSDVPQKIVVKATSDIYTALLGIAAAFVTVGLLYVGWRSLALFGSVWPHPAQ